MKVERVPTRCGAASIYCMVAFLVGRYNDNGIHELRWSSQGALELLDVFFICGLGVLEGWIQCLGEKYYSMHIGWCTLALFQEYGASSYPVNFGLKLTPVSCKVQSVNRVFTSKYIS